MSNVIRSPAGGLARVRRQAVQRLHTAMLIFLIALVACAAGLAYNPDEVWLAAASLALGIFGASAVLLGVRRGKIGKPKPVAAIRYVAFHPSTAVWAPHYHSTQRPPRR